MKTQEEMIEKYDELQYDLLPFSREVLVNYLTVGSVKKMGWQLKEIEIMYWGYREPNDQNLTSDMKSYMEFAWDKARNHRVTSSIRSLKKFEIWLWLLNKESEAQNMGNIEYTNYGAPVLKYICEVMQFPIPDDEALQNMMQSKPCVPDCVEGCGR